MKQFIKKLFGIDKIEQETAKAVEEKLFAEDMARKAMEAATEARLAEEHAKLSPKERATADKQPWVGVLETHVNTDNIRNGFFELDWNEYFVVQLREAGYRGESEEEIVDSWFKSLCANVAAEEGVNMDRRGSGYVNRALRDDGRTEVY